LGAKVRKNCVISIILLQKFVPLPLKMNQRDRRILQIAIPSIVSNITVPLLGMIDVTIVGHMGSAAYIGAVAVGSMIFNLVYWLFGFLRMGTSGTTSQALGRRDFAEVTQLLGRSLGIAMAIALSLMVLQTPLKWLVFELISPTADVVPFASCYFDIVIWGAPAMLGVYSLIGWFIGMQNTRMPNILASLTLVYGFGMKIEGVAWGTVIAQYGGFIAALVLFLVYYRHIFRFKDNSYHTQQTSLLDFLKINRDIFLRTICLVAVNLFFTSAGARSGAVILSVNTVMLQFYLLFSYFMDGFAYAGEALCGKMYGAKNHEGFDDTLRHLFRWMVIVTIVFTLLYVLTDMRIVKLLTNESEVISTARSYVFWTWLIPIAGSLAFIWDGVFIGMTATRGMLVSSFVASLLFFLIYYLFFGSIANHALWLAQIVFLMARGVVQSAWFLKHAWSVTIH
jgi:MATE family multidrug resistance protein